MVVLSIGVLISLICAVELIGWIKYESGESPLIWIGGIIIGIVVVIIGCVI